MTETTGFGVAIDVELSPESEVVMLFGVILMPTNMVGLPIPRCLSHQELDDTVSQVIIWGGRSKDKGWGEFANGFLAVTAL